MRLAMILAIAALVTACGDQHKTYVKLFLNDPESAQFRNVKQSTKDPEVTCGELNARNRLGGMVGFTRYILVLPDGSREHRDDHELVKVLSKFHTEQESGFDAKWALWCY